MRREEKLALEVRAQLEETIIPFWEQLQDNEFGGYYGFLSYDLELDKKAVKGCILNSRITWFFSNAYTVLKKAGRSDETLLAHARHGYEFMRKYCIDYQNGGIYWSVRYDGTPEDTSKHTYNQAFCIYALASYYEASKEEEARTLAFTLFHLIEEKCRDEVGYLESFSVDFLPESNEKLSENGVLADKTMNTLLHIFEAYTELYRISNDAQVKEKLEWILDVFAQKVYNPKRHRQEVFFDKNYHSILDLHSYGHDIETAWLIDLGVQILSESDYEEKMLPITQDLTETIYRIAFDGRSLANECEKGVVNQNRIWWVQAEAIVGFFNGYQKNPQHFEYLEAAENIWNFVKAYLIDKRVGSEWYWEVHPDGTPILDRPIVEPWKCPYHNGRMALELIKRIEVQS